MGIPEIGTVVAQAERAERAGWDGITFIDSQNLVGDPFVAVALAAGGGRPAAVRDRRHQRVHPPSGGARERRGHGAGDVGWPVRARHRPRRHRAVPPRPEADAGRRRSPRRSPTCRRYLANETIDCDGRPSRLQWLDRCRAAEGPARHRGVGPADDRVRGPHRRARHARGRRRSRSRRVGDRTSRARRRPTPGAIRRRSRSART